MRADDVLVRLWNASTPEFRQRVTKLVLSRGRGWLNPRLKEPPTVYSYDVRFEDESGADITPIYGICIFPDGDRLVFARASQL